LTYSLGLAKLSKKSSSKLAGIKYAEELTTKEFMDLRIILIRFMVDKEAHKKMPCLVSRAPKLWNKVDRIYKSKRKGNCGGSSLNVASDISNKIRQME